MNSALSTTLIPNAQNSELKSLLERGLNCSSLIWSTPNDWLSSYRIAFAQHCRTKSSELELLISKFYCIRRPYRSEVAVRWSLGASIRRSMGPLEHPQTPRRRQIKRRLCTRFDPLSLDDAQRVIQAGIAKANEIGSPSNIAVGCGDLLAFARRMAWQHRHRDQQGFHVAGV